MAKALVAAMLAISLGGAGAAFAQSAPDKASAPSFRDDRRLKPSATEVAPSAAKPAETSAAAPSVAVSPAPTAATDSAGGNRSAATACGAPTVTSAPLEAGRMRVAITSSCRAGQPVTWAYGGAEFEARLDAGGRAELIVDCFAGTSTPVEIKLADDTLVSLPVEAADLDKLTKIAILWRAPVNLDLHALEYAALPGQAGHVSPATPRTLAEVRDLMDKSGRGAGFVSTASGQEAARDRLEVYTFLHRDGQAAGIVATALDYQSRGGRPEGEMCGAGPLAEIPFRIVTLSRRGQVAREAGVIAAAPCDKPLEGEARLNPADMPVIRPKS